jgi:hypothetical protein
MDGYKIQIWNRNLELALELGLALKVRGGTFEMVTKTGAMLGVFNTVEAVQSYLCGVEYGRSSKQTNGDNNE